MNRQVLFTRNSDIYDDRDTAIAAIPSIVNEHGMDGCEIHVRYAKGDKIKTILVAVATEGCYSYYEEAVALDETPTEGSSNGVTSGGVYDALDGKVNTKDRLTEDEITEIIV